MYEVNISVEKENTHFINYIEKQLEPVLSKIDGVSASVTSTHRAYYTVACADTYKKQISDIVLNQASDVLAIGYKNAYLREQLGVKNGNFYLNTLLNTMCVFDNNFDKQYIRRILNTNDDIYLDGYFNFKLKRLKDKWKEIVELAESNSIILSDNSLIEEFLAYLLEAINQKVKNLSVVIDGENVSLYDTNGNIIEPLDLMQIEATAEEVAMVNTISIKPKELTIYCNDSVKVCFLDLCEFLFDTKVIKNS